MGETEQSADYEFDRARWSDDYCPGDCTAKRTIASLEQELAEARELLWGSRCVYCGETVGPDKKNQDIADEVLRKHVETCEKHPVAALRARLVLTEAVVEAADDEHPNEWIETEGLGGRNCHMECSRCNADQRDGHDDDCFWTKKAALDAATEAQGESENRTSKGGRVGDTYGEDPKLGY